MIIGKSLIIHINKEQNICIEAGKSFILHFVYILK